MMHNTYGDSHWKKLWEKLEQEGNFGIDYVINPALYPEISAELEKLHNATVIDIGGGTGILGTQLLFGYQKVIPGLRLCKDLERARSNVSKFITLEGQSYLIERGKNYLKDVGSPHIMDFLQFHIDAHTPLPYKNDSISLGISRNFLMHLSTEDLEIHVKDMARCLQTEGKYITAFLNPHYELWKYKDIHKGKTLQNGEQYSFSHGKSGEHGIFYHYYKTLDVYESIFEKYFHMEKKIIARPIDSTWKDTYERYYQKDCPLAYVYVLMKK